MKIENYSKLTEKTVVISGSTGGIGKCVVRYLAMLGANIVLLDRNHKKSSELRDKIISEYPNIKIQLITADMSDFASLEEAAQKLLQLPIDFLIHNAGAYSIPRYICDTGYDNLFQINFVSPYYLTKKLLPLLEERGARVIAVSSIAHNYSKCDEEDIDFRTRAASSLAYGNAKRWLTYSLYELFENQTKSTLAIVHPGITFTGITNHYPKIIFALIKYPMKIIFMRPKKASLSIIKGIFENCDKNEWIGPRFFNIWGRPKKQKLNTALPQEIKYIYKKAEEIYQDLQQKNTANQLK